MNQETRPKWMNEESVKTIAPEKLAFLEELYQKSHGKTQKQLLSLLMPLLNQAKAKGLLFTPQEMNAAINAIRKHSTKEELEQMDQLLTKAQKGISH